MSINHLNIQNKQTGDKLSATEFNSTTSKINEVVDGVNASATGGKIGSNGTPLTKDSSGRIIIPLATSSSSGAMSASDKSKLDSINPSGGAAGDYVDSISNEANYTANDMYDTTSEFYGTNHKINTRSISYTTSDGSTHTFTHLDTVYKVATPPTTTSMGTVSGKAGLMSAQDKQKLDMMPRPSDITSALSGKANKQIIVLVTRTQQGSTYVYSASKTFTEISTAIGNGTNVILQYDGNYYHLSYSTRDYIVFTRFVDDVYMYSSIEVNSHDEWSYSSFILQEELTIDSTPTRNSNNLVKSGGVYAGLASKLDKVEIIEVTGSGTASDPYETETPNPYTLLTEAVDAGVAAVWVKHGEEYYHLNKDNQTEYKFHFTNVTDNGSIKTFYIDDNDNITFTSVADISSKQDALVSGVNIKTVNNITLLGSGNIDAKELVYGKIQGTSFYSAIRNPRSGNWAFARDAETPNEQKIYIDILTNIIYKYDADVGYVQIGGGQIKTINGQSLIGSGNVTLDTELIDYDGDGNAYFSPGDSLTEGLDSMADAIDNINPNEISSVTATESTASGGNNVVTITQTNGTTTSFNVKNGIDGVDGQDGADGVSLGEVALVQTTGDDEESVMSQKAVTDYGRKVTAEDLNGTSDWIKSILENEGWVFGQYLISNGSGIANTEQPYAITHIISVDYIIRGHQLVFKYNNNKNTSSYVNWYNDGTRQGYLIGLNTDIEQTTTVPLNNLIYNNANGLRFTINYNDIPNCSIYDNTEKKYIWRGDEYLYNLIKMFDVSITYKALLDNIISQELGVLTQKTISQKVITEQFERHDYLDKRYSYVSGCLCNFKFEDYPLFDLREAEGVSLVMDGQNEKISSYHNGPFLVISDGGALNGSNSYFMFQWYYGRLFAGFVTGWSSAKTEYGVATGTSYIYKGWAHQVITFDFNTGTVTIYINGSMFVTATTPNFDKEGFRTLLRSMTDIYVISKQSNQHEYDINTTGIALFPRVISESEVAQIYGSGGDETKGNLMPQEYNAYDALAHVFTEWNIAQHGATATVTNNDNGGKTLTLNSGKTDFFFALIGMSSPTSYYHIIDFDFTILSGSCMFSNVQYGGQTYKQVVTITDSSGSVVDFETTTLTAGNTYHMRCQPSKTINPSNYGSLNVAYRFINAEEGTSIWVHEEVLIREAGTPLKFTRDTYRGDYWKMYNGEHLPASKIAAYQSVAGCSPNYNPYKQSTIIYSSSKLPQFNGQMAVDSTNNKVYVGILNVSGGTWKQINNS